MRKCCGIEPEVETVDKGTGFDRLRQYRVKCQTCGASTDLCMWKPDSKTLWDAKDLLKNPPDTA